MTVVKVSLASPPQVVESFHVSDSIIMCGAYVERTCGEEEEEKVTEKSNVLIDALRTLACPFISPRPTLFNSLTGKHGHYKQRYKHYRSKRREKKLKLNHAYFLKLYGCILLGWSTNLPTFSSVYFRFSSSPSVKAVVSESDILVFANSLAIMSYLFLSLIYSESTIKI